MIPKFIEVIIVAVDAKVTVSIAKQLHAKQNFSRNLSTTALGSV